MASAKDFEKNWRIRKRNKADHQKRNGLALRAPDDICFDPIIFGHRNLKSNVQCVESVWSICTDWFVVFTLVRLDRGVNVYLVVERRRRKTLKFLLIGFSEELQWFIGSRLDTIFDQITDLVFPQAKIFLMIKTIDQ